MKYYGIYSENGLGAELRVNRTYYKSDLKGGRVNYEF